MIRDYFILSILLIAFVGIGYGSFLYLNRSSTLYQATKEIIREDESSQLEDSYIEVPVISFIEEKNSDPTRRYTTNITYPVIALVGHADAAKETNAVIKTFAYDILHEFQKGFQDDMVITHGELASDFSMRSNATLLSPTILSVRFDSSEYLAGTPHPNRQTQILNYDMEQHRILTSADLFTTASTSLIFLSEYTRDALRKKFADSEKDFAEMVTFGTTPEERNFRSIAITKEGLLVIFDPYQVAEYGRGTQEVRIPIALVSSQLNPRVFDAITLAGENFAEAVPEEQIKMEY
jgi:hypothetical protein